MSDPPPLVSVIIPARDAEADLGAALEAVAAGDYPADRLEILVVVGPSRDGTAPLAAAAAAGDPRVRVIRNPDGSTPLALNRGLAAARGTVVVRIDAHTRPAPDYVRACVTALRRTGAAAVGGCWVGRGATPFGRAAAVAATTRFGAGDARFRLGGEGPVDTVYLGAWTRAVLAAVGGFNRDLARNQDYELCLRIRGAGGIVWLDPAIRSTTRTRDTPLALARQYFDYGRGRAATVVRHPRSLKARQALPAALVAGMGAATWLAARRPAWRGPWRAAATTYLAASLAASLTAARRLAGRDAVRLPCVYGIMHVMWGAGFWVGLAGEVFRRRRGARDTRARRRAA